MKPLCKDTSIEIQSSAALQQLLIEKGSLCPYDDDDDSNERKAAIAMIENLVAGWMEKDETIKLYRQAREVCLVDPVIVTFGSYALRVHRRDSDVDALCLFDKKVVTREMFFSNFVDFLRKDSRVSDLLAIENAFTPVIKFLLKGLQVQVDLLFASVSDSTKLFSFHKMRQQTQNPVEYKLDDSDLVGMDEASVRSLNGVRVTQFIEKNVKNLQSFRICLCAIKDWAT